MKKDFSNTAAAAFFTQPEEVKKPTRRKPAKSAPAPDKVKYWKPRAQVDEETRSRRVLMLMRPSVYEAASNYAQANKISFGSIVELALEEYLLNHTTAQE
jgi:hypothetical protein